MTEPRLISSHPAPTVSQSRAELAEAMLLALATAQDTGQRKRFRALAGFVLQKIAGETSPGIATRFFLGRTAPTVLRGLVTAGHTTEARRLCRELETLELVPPVPLGDGPGGSAMLRELSTGLASYESGEGAAQLRAH